MRRSGPAAGQQRLAHQVLVDRGGAGAALGDGPHDQALAAAHVAADEHAVDVWSPSLVAGDVAPVVELDAELLEQALALGADEAHGQQHQLARAARSRCPRPSRTGRRRARPRGPRSARTPPSLVAEEALGVDRVHRARRPPRGPSDTRNISGQVGHGLTPASRSSGGRGMISNWWIDAAPWRWAVPRQSAPVSPPPMMTTCLPSAVIWPLDQVALLHPVGRAAGTPSPGGCRRARGRGWAGRATGWRRRPARPRRSRSSSSTVTSTPDVDAGAELGALGPHLVEAPVEVALLHLELGDAVAQQPADAVGPLEDDDVVAGPGQLLGGGQARRAASRRRPPACRCAPSGGTGCDPALGPRPGR